MCGICGWAAISGAAPPASALDPMVTSLRHRGPNNSGTYLSGRFALGHTRLAILDLQSGDQPMGNSDDQQIVFNGEIYNFRSLKKELEGSGISFSTTSDTEVVLAAYSQWGAACVNKLEGMFSFVIADPKQRTLFIARDHFGKKPLHYFFHNGLFIFASEIKALLQHPIVGETVRVNEKSLIDYLSLGYILTPKTIFNGISRLPPATYATFNWHTGNFSTYRYWKYENCFKQDKFTGSSSELEEQFREYFSRAVNSRLNADVPISICLSSGLDSSSVASVASKSVENSLNAFSISFSEPSFDESENIRSISRDMDLNLNIQQFRSPSKSELSRLIWHFDEPFADNSALPTFQLTKLISASHRVALSGDGADELFAGYPTYRANSFFNWYRKTPAKFSSSLQRTARFLFKPSYRKVSFDYKLNHFLKSHGLTQREAHYWWRIIFPLDNIQSILCSDFLREQNDYSPYDTFAQYFERIDTAPFLDQCLYVDSLTWLADDILVKTDRMSMANSVEIRSPFLDKSLAEFAARLPITEKLGFNSNKRIVRNAMARELPKKAHSGTKKGFNSPSRPITNIHAQETSFFQKDFKLDSDKEDITFKSHNILMLELWFDIYNNFKRTGKWESINYD
jgi:asparagine synthase (glutamine-hydrolysing)